MPALAWQHLQRSWATPRGIADCRLQIAYDRAGVFFAAYKRARICNVLGRRPVAAIITGEIFVIIIAHRTAHLRIGVKDRGWRIEDGRSPAILDPRSSIFGSYAGGHGEGRRTGLYAWC